MKVLVVSDSHGDFSSLRQIHAREKPLDLLIHLGDGVLDALLLQKMTGVRVEAVNGNNDPHGAFPEELTLKLEETVIYLTHGYTLHVRAGLQQLVGAARRAKANLALFGHTHQHQLVENKGLTLFNPGAACRWGLSSYAVLEIEGKTFKIKSRRL